MLTMIEKQLYETQIPIQIRLPYQEGQLISLIHEQGHVSSIHHERNSVTIHGSVPGRLYTQFQPYLVNTNTLIEEE